MHKLIVLTAFSFAISVSGCSKDSGKPGVDPIAATTVTAEVGELNRKIENLETRIFSIELANKENKAAWFDPTESKSFQRVDANVGYFLVILENVEPYLDGQKVTLLIGNPNNVTFSGFKIKASWAGRMPNTTKLPTEEKLKVWKAYTATQGEKEIELTETLRPGTWNKVGFVVAPARAGEFGGLGIAMITNKVMLAGGR